MLNLPDEVNLDIEETLDFCGFILNTLDTFIQGAPFENYVFNRIDHNPYITLEDYNTAYRESREIFQLAVTKEREAFEQEEMDPFQYKQLNDFWFALWQSGLTGNVGRIKRNSIINVSTQLNNLNIWNDVFLNILDKLLKLINTFLKSLVSGLPGADALDEIKQAAETLIKGVNYEN